MKIYLADTAPNSKLGKTIRSAGIPSMVSRGRLHRAYGCASWAFDNGAFMDWKQGREFEADAYRRDLDDLGAFSVRPDFLVVPDIVSGGSKSADFSASWLARLDQYGIPLYWAVQDGQTEACPLWDDIDGIFVGGTTEWKLSTGKGWVTQAHARGIKCHIGRVGTPKRVRWVHAIGADSIDSSQPLWSRRHWELFWGAVWSAQHQMRINWDCLACMSGAMPASGNAYETSHR